MLNKYALNALKFLVFIGIALNVIHPKQIRITRLTLGVIVLSAVMLPFVDIMDKNKVFDAFTPTVSDEESMGDDMIERLYEDAIKEYVAQLCKIDNADVKVTVDGLDVSSMKAKRIYVSLSGKGITVDYRNLETRLANEFTNGGDCKVELDIG